MESIKRHFKSRLVGTVLNGYLCLRKLVLQRTKLIDETQDMLLEMLEDMTTGNPAWKLGAGECTEMSFPGTTAPKCDNSHV